MKKSRLTSKEVAILLICFIPLVFNIGIGYFFTSDIKVDIYLFYDHPRYLDNIFYDLYNLSINSIFTYYASKYKRKLFKPFFWISLVNWGLYFTLYKQHVSLITIPLLLIFIYIALNGKQSQR